MESKNERVSELRGVVKYCLVRHRSLPFIERRLRVIARVIYFMADIAKVRDDRHMTGIVTDNCHMTGLVMDYLYMPDIVKDDCFMSINTRHKYGHTS